MAASVHVSCQKVRCNRDKMKACESGAGSNGKIGERFGGAVDSVATACTGHHHHGHDSAEHHAGDLVGINQGGVTLMLMPWSGHENRSESFN
jgi:hypothetical protein